MLNIFIISALILLTYATPTFDLVCLYFLHSFILNCMPHIKSIGCSAECCCPLYTQVHILSKIFMMVSFLILVKSLSLLNINRLNKPRAIVDLLIHNYLFILLVTVSHLRYIFLH